MRRGACEGWSPELARGPATRSSGSGATGALGGGQAHARQILLEHGQAAKRLVVDNIFTTRHASLAPLKGEQCSMGRGADVEGVSDARGSAMAIAWFGAWPNTRRVTSGASH
jgi:hypothetical protein